MKTTRQLSLLFTATTALAGTIAGVAYTASIGPSARAQVRVASVPTKFRVSAPALVTPRRYEETGLNITFTIPRGFHIGHDLSISRSSGANAVDQAAIALDQDNLIIVQRYNLATKVTSRNLSRFKAEVDEVVSGLAGEPVSGRLVSYGGLPGYEYVIGLRNPRDGSSRLAVLFDNEVEYLLNCQSTPSRRVKIDRNCPLVLKSIRRV